MWHTRRDAPTFNLTDLGRTAERSPRTIALIGVLRRLPLRAFRRQIVVNVTDDLAVT